VNIEFKLWCANTKHEHTEVTIKSDGITFSEDNLSDEDLCNLGFEFLSEGLRNKGRYEMIQALIDLGVIDRDQIGEWWMEELNESY
jgi:hypothetical protein